MQSVQRANEALGRVNIALENKGRVAHAQEQVLEAVTRFHNQAVPGQTLQDVIDGVVKSAKEVMGKGSMRWLVLGVKRMRWRRDRYGM